MGGGRGKVLEGKERGEEGGNERRSRRGEGEGEVYMHTSLVPRLSPHPLFLFFVRVRGEPGNEARTA